MWIFSCFPSSLLLRPHLKTIVQLQTIRWDQKALFGVCQCARWLSEKNAIIQEVFCLEYFFCEKRHLSMDLFVPCVHFYNAAIHFIRNNIQKFYRMHLLFFCKIVWSIQMVEFNFKQPFFSTHSCFFSPLTLLFYTYHIKLRWFYKTISFHFMLFFFLFH